MNRNRVRAFHFDSCSTPDLRAALTMFCKSSAHSAVHVPLWLTISISRLCASDLILRHLSGGVELLETFLIMLASPAIAKCLAISLLFSGVYLKPRGAGGIKTTTSLSTSGLHLCEDRRNIYCLRYAQSLRSLNNVKISFKIFSRPRGIAVILV